MTTQSNEKQQYVTGDALVILKMIMAEANKIHTPWDASILRLFSHTLKVLPSSLPNAGLGVFVKGTCKSGEIVGIYPGLLMSLSLLGIGASHRILAGQPESVVDVAKKESTFAQANLTLRDIQALNHLQPTMQKLREEYNLKHDSLVMPYSAQANNTLHLDAEFFVNEKYFELYGNIAPQLEDVTRDMKNCIKDSLFCQMHMANHSLKAPSVKFDTILMPNRHSLPEHLRPFYPVRVVTTEENQTTMDNIPFLVMRAIRDVRDEEILVDYGWAGVYEKRPTWYKR